MDWVLLITRILGVASMAAATGISLVELKRLRDRAPWVTMKGLHAVLVASSLGLAFRIFTSIYAFGIDIPIEIVSIVANSFFIILGFILGASALGVYREAMEREAMEAVKLEIEKRLED